MNTCTYKHNFKFHKFYVTLVFLNKLFLQLLQKKQKKFCRPEVRCVHCVLLSLLPPANEVWGKVIFLHLSVILFTGRGGEYLGRYTPRAGTPPTGTHPGRYTLRQVHPPGRYASYWNALLFLHNFFQIYQDFET